MQIIDLGIDALINKFRPPFRYEEKVLDHGYVRFVEAYGSDQAVIEDARMSTNKGFQGWEKDAKLLKYLYAHKHMTPFEGSGMKIEIVAPIMVFREWQRHRTQAFNEMSARYTPLPDVNYVPDANRCIVVSGENKQAASQSGKTPTHEQVLNWIESLQWSYEYAQMVYARGLEIGIPKEVARLPVPVARYSKMRATASLRNWIAFLTLREDPSAQWEIREYAHVVSRIIMHRFPRTWDLYIDSKIIRK